MSTQRFAPARSRTQTPRAGATSRSGTVPQAHAGMVALDRTDVQALQRLAGNGAMAQLLGSLAPTRSPQPVRHEALAEADVRTVQRHASFEHRMLGDVPPADLFALGAQEEVASSGRSFVNIPLRGGGSQQVVRSNIEHILEQELKRLKVWQQQDPQVDSMTSIGNKLGAAKAGLEQNDPTWNVRLVAIESTSGGKPLLVTYGELNTLADFYGSVDELKAADATKRRNVVQSVRNQSYDKLLEIYTKVVTGATAKQKLAALEKKPGFKGSFGISSVLDEVGQMTKDKKGALDDTTKYKVTLGRNACHLAPESWHSWEKPARPHQPPPVPEGPGRPAEHRWAAGDDGEEPPGGGEHPGARRCLQLGEPLRHARPQAPRLDPAGDARLQAPRVDAAPAWAHQPLRRELRPRRDHGQAGRHRDRPQRGAPGHPRPAERQHPVQGQRPHQPEREPGRGR